MTSDSNGRQNAGARLGSSRRRAGIVPRSASLFGPRSITAALSQLLGRTYLGGV